MAKKRGKQIFHSENGGSLKYPDYEAEGSAHHKKPNVCTQKVKQQFSFGNGLQDPAFIKYGLVCPTNRGERTETIMQGVAPKRLSGVQKLRCNDTEESCSSTAKLPQCIQSQVSIKV